MDQDAVSQSLNAFFQGMFAGLGDALFPIVVLILSAYVAAPAIGSILFVWAGARWPLLERSIVAACAAGVVITAVVGAVLIYAVAGIGEAFAKHDAIYLMLPYPALVIVALAGWFQYRERATFSRARGAAIAGAVLLPFVLWLFG